MKGLTLVTIRHVERLQLFHLNTEMVIKWGFSVFWWWLCREVLLFFWETVLGPQNAL